MIERNVFSASDPEQVKSRREKQKTRELQKKAALRRLISDPAGRMWIRDLMTRCGAYHSSFSTDPLVMAFNEGRRDIGNYVISEIDRIDPELSIRMALENRTDDLGADPWPRGTHD
jgi:hypothetical protein